ncbi:hypothetical protein H5T58_02610, partial [Candidatus Parcubacteria bacterium]|nr:hypothetical protein [Candidatus Parcubacteria bacterium]
MKSFFKFLLVFCLFIIFSSFSNFALAQKTASLYLSPASGSFQEGKTFTISVLVRSEQQAINAAEATIKFDPTIIRVRSVSKSGSIFSLWPEEPTFSNSAGTVKFVGGSPTPYKGSGGRIVTITFEALKEGTASLEFTQGKVLAADGLGTDITDRLIGANYTITPRTQTPPPVEVSPLPQIPLAKTPPAPKISSPTHPDPEKWYNTKNPKVVWEVPSGILSVKTLLGKNPNVQPTVVYEPPISEESFENLEDGVWYFSAQFKNEYGWGEIGRFKIQIDTTPPKEFYILVDNEGDPKNTRPLFKFETTDELSGIDYYEVILNGQTLAKVTPEQLKDGAWRPESPLQPGDYTLEVKCFDKAGNSTFSSLTFSIEPIYLEIYPFRKKIEAGNPIKIEGKTEPLSNLKLYIQRDGQIDVKETKANENGSFKFEETLPIGKYKIWIQAQDSKGRLSISSKEEIEVVKARLLLYFTILLIIFILIGLMIILYLLRKIKKEREKLLRLE